MDLSCHTGPGPGPVRDPVPAAGTGSRTGPGPGLVWQLRSTRPLIYPGVLSFAPTKPSRILSKIVLYSGFALLLIRIRGRASHEIPHGIPSRQPAGTRSRETASRTATKAWTDGDWEVKQPVVLSGKEYHHHFFFLVVGSPGSGVEPGLEVVISSSTTALFPIGTSKKNTHTSPGRMVLRIRSTKNYLFYYIRACIRSILLPIRVDVRRSLRR